MNMNSYVPAHLAIEAMRDNGYKNTAYAVAELLDNSIQAEADYVELICAEEERFSNRNRKVRRIHQIAVLDNGAGMTKDVLKMALQFGNGTRLDRNKRNGIGRFGMGLPASSVSQCKRVDIWTWQDGIENAYHTYLDVDVVKTGRSEVPDPKEEPIPTIWLKSGKSFGKSGTLVVWSKLDRLIWSRANTLIDNSELLIGRLYRKFLEENHIHIRMASFLIDEPENAEERFALPNDPCYLMECTSCPPPFDRQPMFEPWGEEVIYNIEFQGESHSVTIRFSCAKPEVREGARNAGSTPHGKHASKNVGISIVRAGRELDLDKSMVNQYDPTERWWGVEIDFPPALDELMGVTNNKQAARNLTDVFMMDMDSLLKDRSFIQLKEEMEEENDPKAPLLDIVQKIKNTLSVIRKLLKKQTEGQDSKQRYKDIELIKTATNRTNERKAQGYYGTSDHDEGMPSEVKEEEIKQQLIDAGVEKESAEELVAKTISDNLKYVFAPGAFESDAFFSVQSKGGTIEVILNKRHSAYEHLIEVLDKDPADCDIEDLKERLGKASEGIKLLLMAWARYEDELPSGPQKIKAEDTRKDWGRIARDFLTDY